MSIFEQIGDSKLSFQQKTVLESKNYNRQKQVFVNLPTTTKPMAIRISKLMKNMLTEKKVGRPRQPLPEQKPNWADFLGPSKEIKFIWLGHSSFLVNLDQKILLFDPVFNSASPFNSVIKRFQAPVITLAELPPIDYVVLSHDHYDHLDAAVIKFFKDKQTPFLCTLGVGSRLVSWGISTERITEADWWQEVEMDELKLVCTPAQHFSGRSLQDRNRTLWGSWVVIGRSQRFYFSGDSGYAGHFKAIGEQYGPFDLTFIENGQYNEMWRYVHMLPQESAQAHLDLKGKKMVPVHWGMFKLALHNWYDPIVEASYWASQNNSELLTPKIGEVVDISTTAGTEDWWLEFLPEGIPVLA